MKMKEDNTVISRVLSVFFIKIMLFYGTNVQ